MTFEQWKIHEPAFNPSSEAEPRGAGRLSVPGGGGCGPGRPRMNRFLRAIFWVLATLLGVFGVLIAWELHTAGLPVLRARTFWAALAGGAFFAVAAARFSARAKFKVFLPLLAFGLVEALLQALGWLGLLPAVNTKERLPWGRVYWTAEGQGNSVRNRYGWYCPEFDPEPTNRIAVIGDSFVEAVEVHRTRGMSAVLQGRLRAAGPSCSVLALGDHGRGPAQYLEILKYAQHHFAIREAILVVYLGNDITDCAPRLQVHDPAEHIYYTLATNGMAVLEPAGERTRANYERRLESLHRPAWLFLPRLAVSHCLCVQLPMSVQRTLALRKRIRQEAERSPGPETQLAKLGLKAGPFAVNPPPEAREGVQIMNSLLEQSAALARTHDIQLRIVVVPFFPPEFYAQPGPEWTARLGEYDFLGPERELAAWAARRQIPFLGLGERMRVQRLTPGDIRALYLSQGSGHFSEAGHRFAAKAMQDAFYPAVPTGQ